MIDIDALVGRIALRRENQTRAVSAVLDALLNREKLGVVLADEVGCGKTYEALAAAALLWAHHRDVGKSIRRILIVADGALMTKWFNEVETAITPGANAGSQKGFQQYVQGDAWSGFRNMLARTEKLERQFDGDKSGVVDGGKVQLPPDRVYITKPRLLSGPKEDASRYIRYLLKTDWDLLIVDEAHNFTNLKTQRSKIFFPEHTIESREHGLKARYVLALTATPFQLDTAELLHLLRIVRAPSTDLEALTDALPRYERALDAFHAHRHLAPSDETRRRCVDHLERLRARDACNSARPGVAGLEGLLKQYIVRNVKGVSQRAYSIASQSSDVIANQAFEKLDDMRKLVVESPLLPLKGADAWVYMQVRDLIDDARASSVDDSGGTPTFVSGDLRQCLSSYEQLAESKLVKERPDLPRSLELQAVLTDLKSRGHLHPKVAAICSLVDELLRTEIERARKNPSQHMGKILVFNTLMHTADTLQKELQKTVEARLVPFIEECVRSVGWADVKVASDAVRAAVGVELDRIRGDLDNKFAQAHLMVDRDLFDGKETGAVHIVEAFRRRVTDHCCQPLFILRMALYFAHRGETPSEEEVQWFLMRHVTDRLCASLDKIVDDYLDDTPVPGTAEENRERAMREIARLARILGQPRYVGRFDGKQPEADRERRKDNFNRPYAPLVLLVSRVGEEGIDLQAHTRYVLHYDVEWNPARMEQREGRVDREGRLSTGPVQVQFYLLKDTYEERVFQTVMQRNAWFEILIGSKRKELAKGAEEDVEQPTSIDVGEENFGRLTSDERKRVMLNLAP